MQAVGLAVADVGLKRSLVLQRRGAAEARGPEQRPRRFQRELIDHRLVLVDRRVDAVELLDREHVGREPLLDLAEALLVRRLEGFEGAHEVVEGERHVFARATRRFGLDVLDTSVRGMNVFGQVKFAHVILFLGGSFAGESSVCPALPRPSVS